MDVTSPFYLHPSNNLGISLVSQCLTGDNYSFWCRSMILALTAKNKFGFVDGTIPIPDELDPLFHSWKRNNSIVASWILNSVSKEVASSIIYSSSASEIWLDLQERFKQSNGPKIFELKRELLGLQQGTLSVSQYFTKLKSLWEEFVEHRPAHTCNCGGS